MPHSSPDPSRAAIRMVVVAIVLVAAAAAVARLASRHVEQSGLRPLGATEFAGPLRDESERLLEGHLGFRDVPGTVVCGAAWVGAADAAAPRRRVAVQALCREVCLRGGAVRDGMATAFPAALDLVSDGSAWHAVGYSAPTDAHYARDVAALFPPAVRRLLDDDGPRRAAEARVAERVRARWPGARRDPAATVNCGDVTIRGAP